MAPIVESPIVEGGDARTRFHQSEVFRFSREELAEELLSDARSSLGHEYLPSSEIRLKPCISGQKRCWPKADRFPDLHQTYVEVLNSFDEAVRGPRRSGDMADLERALMVLIEAANTLAIRGWEVNWRQNAQWALRGSRFGLSGYSIVERYENLVDRITVSERLEIIGGPIFYMQRRRAEKLGEIKPVVFAAQAEEAYGAAFLSLNSRRGRRYVSDWFVDGRGASYRLLSD